MAVLLQLSLYVLIVLQVASSLSTNGVIQHENENEYLDNFCDYRWPPESSFVNEGGDEGHGRNRYRCCIGLNALQSKVTKLEACCDQVAVTQKHRHDGDGDDSSEEDDDKYCCRRFNHLLIKVIILDACCDQSLVTGPPTSSPETHKPTPPESRPPTPPVTSQSTQPHGRIQPFLFRT